MPFGWEIGSQKVQSMQFADDVTFSTVGHMTNSLGIAVHIFTQNLPENFTFL